MKKSLISFLISLVLVSALGIYLYFYTDYKYTEEPEVVEENIETTTETIDVVEDEEDEEIEEENFLDRFENHEITFLMLGVDSLEGEGHENIRTDTIMVFNCNFDTGKMKILSIPRDTRLLVKGALDKVNHAHAYGGVDLALETINDFLDTDIEYYVKVDYRAVEEVVNAIGGVDIYVPRRMEYYDPTVDYRIDLYEGQQVLDGNQAMQFLRWRTNSSYTAGYREGDIGRIGTQQYFLKEFIKQTFVPKNFLQLPFIARTYFKRVDTNIPFGQILNGINLGRNLDTENVETEIVPGYGTYIDEISYYVVYQNQLKDLLIEMGLNEDTEN